MRRVVIGAVFLAALAATGLRAEEPRPPSAAISSPETSNAKPELSPPAKKPTAQKQRPSKKFKPSKRIDAESVISFPADI